MINTLQTVLIASTFLMCCVIESGQTSGFCGTRTPVIQICTIGDLLQRTSVNIDSVGVPRFQNVSCKCTISPPVTDAGEEFKLSMNKQYIGVDTRFEIKEITFDASIANGVKTITTTLYGKTELWFFTGGRYTTKICLTVSTGNGTHGPKFDITCKRSTQSVTDTLTQSTSNIVTTRTSSVTERQVMTEGETEGGFDIIIPIAAVTAGVICIAGVIVVLVICRRRSMTQKQGSIDTSTPVAEKEEDNDYYMTENPMYNATEVQPKRIEGEYHYMEPDIKDERKSSNQYESLPDSPVGKQFPKKQASPELHYDYTTCALSDQTNDEISEKSMNKTKTDNKRSEASLPIMKPIVGETMYDHTETALPKKFLSVNEYHQISPGASKRNRTVVDTYNTIGNTYNRREGDSEGTGEDSDYHVTNIR